MHAEILAQEGYTAVSVDEAPVRELFPGIRLRPLWTSPAGAHANVLEMDPGTSWPRRDVHEPGPEEVYVVSGTFNDGARLPARHVPARPGRHVARARVPDRLHAVPLLPARLDVVTP
ncbi:anti-sigma factor [Amycolatopsis sp. OK19-0408]|uniref:Anti-sigma factor n=1 Tax=Amycolatopsis iheyensis TaxID=2945988 RepID=A0A9X2SJR2_9PSEU|nr:anti-sigma factor [Amycolatopsis iheyensis]MCR6485002.1 anti-sigma factor [Amycolatopsis iheyensis]